MEIGFSIEELAERSGQPVARLREWWEIGLIGDRGRSTFTGQDALRVRLLRMFLHRGIEIDAVRAWVESGEMDRHVALVAPDADVPRRKPRDVATSLGLDDDLVQRVWKAAGVSDWAGGLDGDDVEAVRTCKAALDAGFPENALFEFIRVFTDAMRRVAASQAHLFHFHIRRSLKASGLSSEALAEEIWKVSDQTLPLAERAVLYFYRRALRDAIAETAVMALAEESGLLGAAEVPGQIEVAVLFVDLVSFTPLTEAMGDVRTAEVLDRYSALVREAVQSWDGHLVKQIGDAFMVVFHVPHAAVACALEIEERVGLEPQFPAARSGVHWGRMLYRDGDYVGGAVNVAARVSAQAERHQVLVTDAVRRAVGTVDVVEFVPLGKRRLKGLAQDVELFEARSAAARTDRIVDPVCGMELRPAEVAARLNLRGQEHGFCSQDCLERYIAAPDRYEAG